MSNPFDISLPFEKSPKGAFFDIKNSKRWVDSLTLGNSGEAAKQLFHTLKEVIYVSFSVTDKLDFLENVRGPIKQVCLSLEKHFLDQPVPLPNEAQMIADLAIEFHHGLAVGYIQSLTKLLIKSDAPTLFNKKTVLMGLNRAMTHLSQSLLRCYQSYVPVPHNAWRDIHHLYQYAVRHNLHQNVVLDTVYHGSLLSVEALYKQALLMSQCDPYSLSGNEVAKIHLKLEEWCRYASLNNKATNHGDKTIMAIDIDSTHPMHAVKTSDAIEMAKVDYVFLSAELISQLTILIDEYDYILEDDEHLLQQQQETRYLFQRVKAAWQGVSMREPRKKGHGHAIVVVGLANIYTVLDTKEDSLPERRIPMATCPVVDVSAKGCRLLWFEEESIKAMVGMLVAFKKKGLKSAVAAWNIGMIRWMRSDRCGAAEMGIEVLVSAAIAANVTVISKEGRESQTIHCLRASDSGDKKQAASLVVPTFIARMNYKLRLQYQEEGHYLEEIVRLAHIKENTRHFACCEYEDDKINNDSPEEEAVFSRLFSDKNDEIWEYI